VRYDGASSVAMLFVAAVKTNARFVLPPCRRNVENAALRMSQTPEEAAHGFTELTTTNRRKS